MSPSETDARTVRLGGRAALASGVVFLITIAYTFGFLFARGLSTDMLNAPSQLLPWVHANTISFVGLWWIFVVHLLLLLPVPAGLAVIAGAERASVRAATVAGIAGAVVGMIAAMVNAATAPALGNAAVNTPAALLPNVWLVSELAGSLGLHLRLLSYLLCAVWLATTGLELFTRAGWRALSVAQLAVSALTVVVVIAKPFDWLDLEPSLGFAFALIYLWIGVALLRVPTRSVSP
ncbi:MAG: hypothetical protein ABIT20_05550 [Gemmatimonadaceae bacterium]